MPVLQPPGCTFLHYHPYPAKRPLLLTKYICTFICRSLSYAFPSLDGRPVIFIPPKPVLCYGLDDPTGILSIQSSAFIWRPFHAFSLVSLLLSQTWVSCPYPELLTLAITSPLPTSSRRRRRLPTVCGRPSQTIMGELVEFYVTSNPVLRPNGVKYILDQLKESKIEVSSNRPATLPIDSLRSYLPIVRRDPL